MSENEQVSLDLGGLPKNHIAITGRLNRFTRKQATELILLLGGIPDQTVTKRSRYLVCGKQIHKSEDGKTIKLRRAEQLQEKDSEIEIISEQEFYRLLKDAL